MKLISFLHAWRNLKKSGFYTFISILSLTLGITCALILTKYVLFEVSTDRFHTHLDELGIASIRATPLSELNPIRARLFFNMDYSSYPEVISYTTINQYNNSTLSIGQKEFTADVLVADSLFFEVFDFSLTSAPTHPLLANPNSILISQALSQKLFGDHNPIGEEIGFEGITYLVSGILDQVPTNSSLKFEAIASAHGKRFWSRNGCDIVRFKPGIDWETFNETIQDEGQGHSQFSESKLSFLPLGNLYFSQVYPDEIIFHFGNWQNILILILIAIIIFAISIFNYINIQSVMLVKRSKVLGIKKILGAGKGYFIQTFMYENSLRVGISILASLAIIKGFQPAIFEFTGRSVFFRFPHDLYLVFGIGVGIILVASIYPAIRFPKIDPIKALKNNRTGRTSILLRRYMLGLQFIATICLLIVSLFFIRQLNYMLNKDLAFNQDNIVKIQYFSDIPSFRYFNQDETTEEEAKKAYEEKRKIQRNNMNFVINEIHKNPDIQHLCFGTPPIGGWESSWKKKGDGEQYHSIDGFSVTPEFDKLYGLEILQGRFFSREKDKSRSKQVVINEAARKFFGIEQIEGTFLSNRYWGDDREPFQIIGVVNDFHNRHLSRPIGPTVMFYHDDKVGSHFMMHITEGKQKKVLAQLAELFVTVNPGKDFTYGFVEDDVAEMYEEDQRVAQIYIFFTCIAMLISAMGLLGISLYDIQQRVKEIGIRKVNGANVEHIILLLSREFTRTIGIAFLIACPVSWYLIQTYLESFAYKASMSVWLFVLAGFLTFTVSYATMLWQCYKAAIQNPVKALRYE